MLRFAYSLLLVLGLLLASPFLVVKLVRGRYEAITRARLGLGSRWLPPRGLSGCIWLHALSVGEVRSALPLVRAFKERFPERPLVFSTATSQGLQVAQEEALQAGATAVFVRPLDLPWAVGRLIHRLNPALFCLVEGDIWPNWQWALKKRGTPCLLVNNRVSPNTFKGYRRLAGLVHQLLNFDRILAQSGLDRQRLLALGFSEKVVLAGGNLKFDSAPARLSRAESQALAEEFGLAGKKALVAGSTHPGEEEPILAALAGLLPRHPDLALIIAPRDVNRGAEVAGLAQKAGLSAARLSQGGPAGGRQVLVLDVLGRLAPAYALALVAFVGGSFALIGGHNLLEPAAQGAPVLFGPVMHNFVEMAQGLEEAGGGLRLAGPEELPAALAELLEDKKRRQAMGEAALAFTRAHSGAVERAVAAAADLLAEAGRV